MSVREPRVVRARCPVRVDFAGGWTDVPRYAVRESGVVANAALALYVQVECIHGGGAIVLHAEDLGEHVTIRSPAELVYDGKLDLHKAALNMLPVTGGVELLSSSEVPSGSGLGASGALDVALVAVLAKSRQETYSPAELAELGFQLEAEELGLHGGRQDQYAAAFGGWHELIFADDTVTVQPIPVAESAAAELAATLVIAYTGQSHFSSQTHERVWTAYETGDPDVTDALATLRDLGTEAAGALRAADWRRLAGIVDENWRQQQRLDRTISTQRVAQVERAAREAGAWGIKAAGAGAGGCLMILAPPDRHDRIRRAMDGVNARVLEAGFDFHGVRVWEADAGT